ncbi:MAG: hypothetical protein ABJP45_02690 [Cyclobacteriaceae bacterium]
MQNVIFSITQSSLEISHDDAQKFPMTNGNELLIFGDLIGAVKDGKIYNRDQLLNQLVNVISIDEVEAQMRNVVGACYVIIRSARSINIYASCSSPGILFHQEGNQVHFDNSEKQIFKRFGRREDLDEDEMLTSIVSHQILLRNPFSSIFRSITRIPGGGKLSFEEGRIKEDLFIMDAKGDPKSKKDYQEFKFLLEGTLQLILDYHKEDEVIVLKSGGIDSAVLLAALKRTDIPCVHLPYGGYNDINVQLAKSIVKYNHNPFGIGEIQNQVDIEALQNLAFAGLGTIAGPQYLKTRLKLGSDDGREVIALSGQNIDTLYHVDTFAPSSLDIGFIRTLKVFKTMSQRIQFSKIFLKRTRPSIWLRCWPFKVANVNFRRKFKDYLLSISLPSREHAEPFHNEEFPEYKEDIRGIFQKTKKSKLFEPLVNLFSRRLSSNLENLSSHEKIHLIKTLRWCRTVHNVPANYQNIEVASNIQRIIPYTQGPLVNFFLHYELSLSEMFKIKEISHKYFKATFGKPHRYFVRKLGNPLLRYLRERRTYRKSMDHQKFSPSFEILRELYDPNEIDFGKIVQNPNISAYMEMMRKRLKNSDSYKWDKSEVMEMCRFVNLSLLLQSVLRD